MSTNALQRLMKMGAEQKVGASYLKSRENGHVVSREILGLACGPAETEAFS